MEPGYNDHDESYLQEKEGQKEKENANDEEGVVDKNDEKNEAESVSQHPQGKGLKVDSIKNCKLVPFVP